MTTFSCSASCGGGSRQRIRYCTHPAPSPGGMHCVGEAEDMIPCNTVQVNMVFQLVLSSHFYNPISNFKVIF